MHYVVQLHFDTETEDKLLKATEVLNDAGMNLAGASSVVRPHMTLVSGTPTDLEPTRANLQKVFQTFPAQDVEFSHIGLFPTQGDNYVLYAGISASEELCRLQAATYEAFIRQGATPSNFSQPGVMVFHSTLAMRIASAQLPQAIELLKGLLPMKGCFTNAALMEYPTAIEKIGFALPSKKPTAQPRNTCPTPTK